MTAAEVDAASTRVKRQFVAPRYRQQQGLEFMKSIRSTAEYVQDEVDLAGGRSPMAGHGKKNAPTVDVGAGRKVRRGSLKYFEAAAWEHGAGFPAAERERVVGVHQRAISDPRLVTVRIHRMFRFEIGLRRDREGKNFESTDCGPGNRSVKPVHKSARPARSGPVGERMLLDRAAHLAQSSELGKIIYAAAKFAFGLGATSEADGQTGKKRKLDPVFAHNDFGLTSVRLSGSAGL